MEREAFFVTFRMEFGISKMLKYIWYVYIWKINIRLCIIRIQWAYIYWVQQGFPPPNWSHFLPVRPCRQPEFALIVFGFGLDPSPLTVKFQSWACIKGKTYIFYFFFLLLNWKMWNKKCCLSTSIFHPFTCHHCPALFQGYYQLLARGPLKIILMNL